MKLKEKLFKNKLLNEENQHKVAEQQSMQPYQLGYGESLQQGVDYSALYDPFVKMYADAQLSLQNNTSDNPSMLRKYINDIDNSVQVITKAIENATSNTEVWGEMVQKASMMGGVDLMGTPESRYRALNYLSGNLAGEMYIKAVNGDINKLAWEIYDDLGFVERIYLNKLNELSEKQDMFISIPDTSKENQDFKMLSSEIFEREDMGGEMPILTGGITEAYRRKTKDGAVEIKQEDMGNDMVQDFYIIDKELISNSLQFNTEMDKISAGMLGAYEGFDEVIAFNNNIIAPVTDYYLQPAKALTKRQEQKFIEDYKTWFLEKEVPEKMPLGDPKSKNMKQPEEQVEEVTVEEQAETIN
jgi:hypothetical protein